MSTVCRRCGQPKRELADGWIICHDCADLVDPDPQP